MKQTIVEVQGCVVAFAQADDTAALLSLTTAEQRECMSLATARQRADYQAGRLAAKRAVAWSDSALLPAPVANEVETLRRISVRRRFGAPPRVRIQAREGQWACSLDVLSLAHCDGRAVAAVAPAGERLGVDVERIGSIQHAYIQYFATATERELGPRDAASLWALKEAAWKALQLGTTVAFSALELEFSADRELTGVTLCGNRLDGRATLLEPWPEHVVAIVMVAAS